LNLKFYFNAHRTTGLLKKVDFSNEPPEVRKKLEDIINKIFAKLDGPLKDDTKVSKNLLLSSYFILRNKILI
jgi:hypothetical protein